MMPDLVHLPPIPAAVWFWPLLFGAGLMVLLLGQPAGRPRPDLAELLRRMDVDAAVARERAEAEPAAPIFTSALLERLLRPLLDDLGRLAQALLGRVGLAGQRNLAGELALVRPKVDAAQFWGEKVVLALFGAALFPSLALLGIAPFGTWPVAVWVLGLVVGFLVPDWDLDRRLQARRRQILQELPVVLDMLSIATSAGLALEQALSLVAGQGAGLLAAELQHTMRAMVLSHRQLSGVLAELATRNTVPELTALVDRLRSSHDQGLPLVQVLAMQAEAQRERERVRLLAEGGRATARMVLPVALFILPVILVVMLVPAITQVMQLSH